MRLRMLGVLLLLPILLITGAPPSAHAQTPSAAEVNALNERAIMLNRAGKYNDAIPLAKRYAAAIKERHGESSPAYANAINNLAQFLTNANRLTEAELLMRRALAIWEKSQREIVIPMHTLCRNFHVFADYRTNSLL